MKYSIVIPAYYSEVTLPKLVERLNKVMVSYEYEIIIVNDGSTDRTSEVCLELTKTNGELIFIDLTKNFGQHNALIAGLKHSTGDYVITIDDDLQNPPEEILKLINKIDEGYDVIYGCYIEKKHSFKRNIGTALNNTMANILLKKPKELTLSSFRVIKRNIVDEITKYEGPYSYIDGLILRVTKNISDVVVEHREREVGESNYKFSSLLGLWMNGFINFSVVPLRVATYVGFFLSAVSAMSIIVLFVNKFVNDVPMGWTSTMMSVLFLGGIQLISIGLMGEYIGRLFLTVNKTPQYAIKEIVKGK